MTKQNLKRKNVNT